MHAVRWFFIAIPFAGLAWVIVEAIIRDRRALLEMALDSEAFARAPVPPVGVEKPVSSAHIIPGDLEVQA